jgi:putative peptidoglycan lipid II flippase
LAIVLADNSEQVISRRSSIAIITGIVAGGYVLSRVLGLFRQVVISQEFGVDNPALSAYFVAFRIPDSLFQLIAGATLSAALIPVFTKVWNEEGEKHAWRMASSVLNLLFLVTLFLSISSFICAPWLVPLVAPGLGDDKGSSPELIEMAVRLTRLMLITPIIFCVSGILTGILNARQHFVTSAIAPCLYNIGIIFGGLWLVDIWGIEGLAYGVILGAAMHLAVQVPSVILLRMRWSPSLDIKSIFVQSVFKLAGPRVLGLAAAQLNLFILILFASLISDASINVIMFAFMIMMLPVGLAGMSIATAIFPTLVEDISRDNILQFRQELFMAFRMTLWLAAPMGVGLVFLADEIIRVLLEHGAFGSEATRLVARAVQILAIGSVGYALVEVLSRGFYALSNTRIPVLISAIAVALNFLLAILLVQIGSFGVTGLTVALSISGLVEAVLLAIVLEKKNPFILRQEFIRSIGSICLGLFAMILCIFLLDRLLESVGTIFKLISQLSLAALIYLVITTQLDRQLFQPVHRWRSKLFRA